MKTFLSSSLIVLLLLSANGIQAQTSQPKLNQVELMKQFIGSWKYDWAKDTTLFGEIKPFGTGLEVYWKYVTNGKIVTEAKELFGYDKKIDKYVAAYLEKGTDIQLVALWFISNNKFIRTYYNDIENPDKSSFKAEGEIIPPNIYKETIIINGKPLNTITGTRIK